MEEILSLTRLGIALAFMVAASVMDLRTRRVPDKVWIVMGIIGLIILAYDMFQAEETSWLGTEKVFSGVHFLIFVPILILFIEPYREWGLEVKGLDIVTGILLLIAALGAGILFYLEGATREVIVLATIPGMMLLFMIFYYTRLIHGGADAKAFMALAIMFPFYPVISGLPYIAYPENVADVIQMTYPFTLLILMNAVILHNIAYPILNFFRNVRNRDMAFPEMFMGYRMDLDDVPKNFVWPLEVVRDDEIVLLLFPKRFHDVKMELDKLRAKGLERIWVQRKAPFIVSMTMGLVFSVIVGNVILLLFRLWM